MTKTLSYTGVAIGALAVILLFVTSKSYFQLGAAIVLYPILAYLTLKLIPRTTHGYATGVPTNQNVTAAFTPNAQASVVIPGKVDIVDIEKRTFLKLVGTAGLSFFVFSLLGRKAEDLIFNRASSIGNQILPPTTSTPSDGATPVVIKEEYKISEIDDGIISYYGFVNKNGNWQIMREDSPGNSFRYARGESDFSKNWQNRENLRYDYYDSLF